MIDAPVLIQIPPPSVASVSDHKIVESLSVVAPIPLVACMIILPVVLMVKAASAPLLLVIVLFSWTVKSVLAVVWVSTVLALPNETFPL